MARAQKLASPNAPLPTPAPKDPNFSGGSFGNIPQMTNGMTFKEVGNSGLRAYGGYIREEFIPNLQGRQAQTVYREMSDNSAVIGGMLASIYAAIKKADWRVNPAADTPDAEEAAEFVDGLRDDMAQPWEEVVSEALTMLPFGFAPLELVYKRRLGHDPGPDPTRPGKQLPRSKFQDGRIGWAKMPVRGQDTILKWFFDENGTVEGLTQQPWIGPLLDIPAEKLLIFRPSEHKGNPEGRSILRNSYRSYFMVKRLEEQEAILAERLGGVPVVRIPSQVMEAAKTDAETAITVENFKNIARNLRIDEQMGVVFPSDVFEGATGPSTVPMYSLELITPGGSKGSGGGGGTNEIINRHNSLILMSVLADFLTLGHGKTGTQALAISKADMFYQATESYLNSTAAVFNRHGLERLWDLNGMDPDLRPELKPDLSQRVDLDVLSNFVLRLAQSGMAIFPNADLESALMDAAGLPDVADTDAMGLLEAGAEGAPMPIAGPGAAMLMPTPEPPPGSSQDQFQKMMRASIARRILKKQGPSMSIDTQKRRRKRLPLAGAQLQLI